MSCCMYHQPWFQVIRLSCSNKKKLIHRIELKTQTKVGTHMDTWFFFKKSEIHAVKNNSIFNKWSCSNCTAECRRIQINPQLSSYIKLNSKWIKDINRKLDTLNLIERKVWNSLELIGAGKTSEQNSFGTGTEVNQTSCSWKASAWQRTLSFDQVEAYKMRKNFINYASNTGIISKIQKNSKT